VAGVAREGPKIPATEEFERGGRSRDASCTSHRSAGARSAGALLALTAPHHQRARARGPSRSARYFARRLERVGARSAWALVALTAPRQQRAGAHGPRTSA